MSGFRIQGVARAAAMMRGACLAGSVVASLVALPAQAARGGPDTFGYTWRDDREVGVTYERNGVQASLAYVEREEATTIGRETFNQNESFTGLTVTMRR